jgi:hypothetical protein
MPDGFGSAWCGPRQSGEIANLAKALGAVQAELKIAIKDKANSFFKSKYADLQTVVDTARPLLVKNGLSVVQLPGGNGQTVTVRTVLLHESGEWLSDDGLAMVPVKTDPQGIASCITYARRYGYMSVIGIVSDDDDDGEAATGRGSSAVRSVEESGPTWTRSPSWQKGVAGASVVSIQAVELLAALTQIKGGGGWNAPSHKENWRKKYEAQFDALSDEDRAEVQKAFLAINTKGTR